MLLKSPALLSATVAAAGLLLIAGGRLAAAGERGDLQLVADVMGTVHAYPDLTIFDDVNASVQEGLVTLSGKVTMPFKREAIERMVARLDGVRRVADCIEVLPASSADDQLRHRIARSIYSNSNFWSYAAMANPPIHIIVEHSRVTLTGVVKSEIDRVLARSLATGLGAVSITDDLKTASEGAVRPVGPLRTVGPLRIGEAGRESASPGRSGLQ